MPGLYDKRGLRFAYPDNWVVDDEERGTAAAAATVTSPATAFWSVMYYRSERNLKKLAGAVLEAMRAEYPQLEVDPVEERPSSLTYDMSFAYVDLLSSATIHAFHHCGGTFLVLSQAEDRELPVVEPVFAAMTASLTQEM